MVTSIRPITPKPKPLKMKRKDSPYCKCKYLSLNREDYKICAKCKKPIKAANIRKVLVRLLDDKVREIVLLRDGFCVTPAPIHGHSTVRQPGHLVSRQKKGVKWDLYNVNEQCSNCNSRHSQPNQWIYYDSWFIRKFGEAQRLRLSQDIEVAQNLSIMELEELFCQLTDILRLQLRDEKFKPYFTQREILSGEWRDKT